VFSKLEELLKKKGVTIADMCRATGINQSVISNLKNRDSNLSFENLVKVAKYLGVPMEYFADGEEED
jgi:transcriptional regulator with XRE-family HTH domain